MKEFYGKWKFSKKRNAMIWKWRRRKVDEASTPPKRRRTR